MNTKDKKIYPALITTICCALAFILIVVVCVVTRSNYSNEEPVETISVVSTTVLDSTVAPIEIMPEILVESTVHESETSDVPEATIQEIITTAPVVTTQTVVTTRPAVTTQAPVKTTGALDTVTPITTVVIPETTTTTAVETTTTPVTSNSGNGALFKLTAYCGGTCCNGKWAGTTATGVKPVEGRTIAICRGQIPYGTEVYIDGYGTYIAEDCGVGWNCIDIYMDSHAATKEFGVQYAWVTW